MRVTKKTYRVVGATLSILTLLAAAVGCSTGGRSTEVRASGAVATGTNLAPNGLTADPSGNVYISDVGNNVVRKVSPAGDISILAGVAGQSGVPTPGPATSSKLSGPAGLALDAAGNVYITDGAPRSVVAKVTPSGNLSIVAGNPAASGAVDPSRGPTGSTLFSAGGVALDTSNNIYIADALHAVVEKVTPLGNLSIVAGESNTFGLPVPGGPATKSYLFVPKGVAVDGSGNVYIADTRNHRVEKVDQAGDLSIVAGNGMNGAPTLSGGAVYSPLGAITGLAVDGNNLYMADPSNDVVEKFDLTGDPSSTALSIVAGMVGNPRAPTPGPATSSALNVPVSVAVGGRGNLYIADYSNNVVEKVDQAGQLTVLAGTGIRPAPLNPTSKDQCTNDGWKTFPQFKDQGDCVSFVETGK